MAAARYGEKVREHFRQPRNAGAFDPAAPGILTGEAGATDQGGLVRLQLRLDASGMIEDTRFKAYGCGVTIAAASWTSEWLKGKTLEQARSLSAQQISTALELSAAKLHCALLVEEALGAAMAGKQLEQE
ncbi:MAG: iron-sulfur cluster assembly scaffold protein [Castellaniella sp.]